MSEQKIELTKDERTTLSVLAFLFYRMGLEDRARRVYEALAELSEAGTADRRFACAGLAAVAIESGDGPEALVRIREALSGGPLSSRDAALHLLQAQAFWLEGRQDEARAARDEYLRLCGSAGRPASYDSSAATGAAPRGEPT